MRIRNAGPGDQDRLLGMARDGEPGITANNLMIYFLASTVLSRHTFIGEVGGEAAGYVFAIADTNRPVLWLHQIVVTRRFRGQGFGQELLQFLLKRAAHDGMQSIELMVKPENPARAFYTAQGFQEKAFNPDMKMYLYCAELA